MPRFRRYETRRYKALTGEEKQETEIIDILGGVKGVTEARVLRKYMDSLRDCRWLREKPFAGQVTYYCEAKGRGIRRKFSCPGCTEYESILGQSQITVYKKPVPEVPEKKTRAEDAAQRRLD